jgi:aminoglycoside 3-N-acetyltransferase
MDKNYIKEELVRCGLRNGDKVLLHSSLSSMGHVEGGAEAVVDAFLDVLGPEGTLVVPVFGALGILTDNVKNRPEAVISDCPKGTVAAIGADAEFICKDHWKAETAHGHGTPYLKLAELGGYICLLGVDQDRNTTLHSVEALLELPYLNTTTGIVETPDGPIEKSWKYYPGPHRDFIGLDCLLRESGIMQVSKIGNAVVRLMRSQDMIDLLLEVGKDDPAFCLCENPACADCVRQRAAIRKARFSKESFQLAAVASLGGNYVPEIAASFAAAGIVNVELDLLEGSPAFMLKPEQLKRAIEELAERGLKISGLRLQAVPADFGKILDSAVAAGIDRVIMPLSESAGIYAKMAGEKNIKLSLFNSSVSSGYAGEIIKGLKAQGSDVSFAFSPAAFAAAGEMPFLQSFRGGKFARYMDQLYVEDGLFSGKPAQLTHGNAEIKELISILRCASFDGFMTFSAVNSEFASLIELAEDLDAMLEEM